MGECKIHEGRDFQFCFFFFFSLTLPLVLVCHKIGKKWSGFWRGNKNAHYLPHEIVVRVKENNA